MSARKKANTKARTAKATTKRTTAKTRSTTAAKSTSRTTSARSKMTKAKATKKAAAVATSARKVSSKLGALSTKVITEKMTKSQIYKEISDVTGLGKNEVQNVLVALRNIVERNVKPRSVGKFKIPELDIQVTLKQKKATKARTGRNPFTGEEIQIPAKPSRKVIKVTALKSLKELAE